MAEHSSKISALRTWVFISGAVLAVGAPSAAVHAQSHGPQSATSRYQQAETRVQRKMRRSLRRRVIPQRHGRRRIGAFCSPGFRVYRTPDQPGGRVYTCVSYIGRSCAPPYVPGTHGVAYTGGDGESYPYYRCVRQRRAPHIGAVKCALGFVARPRRPHPSTHASYRCAIRGLEPSCGPGRHYYSVRKTGGGWSYRCR